MSYQNLDRQEGSQRGYSFDGAPHHPDIDPILMNDIAPSGPSYDRVPSQEHSSRFAHASLGARPSFSLATICRIWWLEILCIIFCTVVLLGVVLVLQNFAGKPVSGWPLPGTINTALAITSAVFKAALIPPLTEGISLSEFESFFRRGCSDLFR